MTTLQSVWTRPAFIIFTDQQPTVIDASTGQYNLGTAETGYLYLTDDSRSPLQIDVERIEYKKRMINGRMRSYHVADKRSFIVSWNDLPSLRTELSEPSRSGTQTAWASGPEMLSWYKSHTDSFYMTLIYDNRKDSPSVPLKYSLETYNVFFDDFAYTVNKRGPTHDLWDVSISLVEV